MRNIQECQLKTAVCKPYAEFCHDVSNAFGSHISVEISEDVLYYYDGDKEIPDTKVWNILSAYYDIIVTSIHIDTFPYTGVWIVYK